MTLLDAIAPASQRGDGNGGKTDLAKLATRIRDDLIEQNQGEDYAAHHVVTQLLLYAVGPFSFERVDIIRGDVLSRNRDRDKPSFSDEHSTVILRNVIVGATCRLTCVVDGRREVIEQTGDVEHPENWQHDGARLKDAESDALKRCAMRFGLGLHLWAQEHYRLDAWLAAKEQRATD
jgi:Rad52/22 family double-strand break repair protein